MIQIQKTGSYTGHTDCIYVLEQSLIAHQFFSSGGDGMVVKWDLNFPDQGELIAKVDNSVYAMAFFPSENWLIIGNNYKGLHVVDLANKKEIKNLHFTEAAIFDILIAEDKVWVATGDGKVHVFSLTGFDLLSTLNWSDKSARCLAYNYHLGHLAIGYSDNSIRISEGNHLLKRLEGHTNSVFSVSYSSDGMELISGSRDAHLKVWKVGEEYTLKTSIVAHMYAVNHVIFSPDGKHYATASMDKSIKLWDAKNHVLLKVIDKSRHAGHGTSVNKLLWTSHQNYLVSGSDDRTISIWNIGF